MDKSTAIVVLSGSRCGSSLVAGILDKLGVFMGDELLGHTPANALGHFEDLAFQRLHKQITGDWRDPTVDFEPYRDQYTALCLTRCRDRILWGVKDPRLAFVFPHFLECVNDDAEVRVIRVYRHTEAAARSMVERSQQTATERLTVTPEQAEMIAERYGKQIESALCEWGGPWLLVDFDELIADPEYHVDRIADFVGVEPSEAAVRFVAPELKHWM